MKASPFFCGEGGCPLLGNDNHKFWLVGQIVYACVKYSFLVGFNLETAVGSQKSAQALRTCEKIT